MELDIAKKLIKKYSYGHVDFIQKASVAERYYKKQNDILFQKKQSEDAENPLRNSDNRIPSNFYKLQVNQKTAYAFTSPPQFDVGNDEMNILIKTTLGDAFAKKCKSLCVQAANSTVGWIHYWRGDDNKFHYAVMDSREVIPIWTKTLEKELMAALRQYSIIDEDEGYEYMIYEFWTARECQAFRRRIDIDIDDGLISYFQYSVLDIDTGLAEMTDTYVHGFNKVPFIFFNNNDEMVSDLSDIKELIDAYDKVFSGFLNDLEDIQELIFILTNYGGEANSAIGVLQEMKQKKIIQVDSDGPDDRSGVSTLAIEIPVEARKEMLAITRKAIFEQGMAIDPDPQNFGNSSGVALKYLYSLLELKTGMMETEFRVSFNHLVRAILNFYGKSAKNIIQTWTRTAVNNDSELAEIAQKSKGVISDETIIRNHPWVENPENEIARMEEQKKQSEPDWDTVPVKKSGVNGEEE